MTAADIRTKIHQQIEQLSPEQLSQVSKLLSGLASQPHQQKSDIPQTQSTARDLLQFAGTWQGKDFEDCLQTVYDDRLPAQF